MNQVAVILVNWNTGQLLRECLITLLQTKPLALISDIIVVDNASTDTSLQQAEEAVTADHSSLVTIIRREQNQGFAGGNNVGLQHIQQKYGENGPHVLLLNPDTTVSPSTVQELVGVLERHPKAGVVGPMLHNPDGSLQPSVRRFPTLWPLLILLLKLPRIWPKLGSWRRYLAIDFDYKTEQTIDQVMGAAFLIRNTVLQQIPKLDENYFVWFEEVDYCQQIRQHGWEVWYTPHTTVIHYGGVSFNQLVGWSRVTPWLHSLHTYAKRYLNPAAHLIILITLPLAWLLSIPASVGHVVLRKRNQARL
jgi:N-acetylglucosaminyl-diphospho-decaprenol L-rhamnosyltransferase